LCQRGPPGRAKEPSINYIVASSWHYTLLLSKFISTSLHVSGKYVPIIRRTFCIYAALAFFTLYRWLSDLSDQTATDTECKIPLPHRYSKFS